MKMASSLMNFERISLVAFVLRWSISHFPYSGAGKPPLYGDYEAQRHWQEITVNLPYDQWYLNSTNNDLLYWGLDYPPLTAYHSYILGVVAKFINKDYVTLNLSRGFESYDHKLFMRYTVLATDIFIYFFGAYFVCKSFEPKKGLTVFLALILYPGLYLIDYGHFQYNNVSLGLLLLAIGCIFRNQDCLGAVAFSLALNYKQMELYHALPFFFFLLAKCFSEKSYLKTFIKFLKIGVSVIFVFFLVWFPFLKNKNLLMSIVERIFPIGRGLFEDKVASFWCSLSLIVKFKNIFENSTMAFICLISTSLLIFPTNVHLFLKPTKFGFKCALVNSALIFFLFSFHVHEKSILLAAIPACLLFYEHCFMISWFLFVSLVSMIPLLIKDGLLIPALSLSSLILLSLFFSIPAEDNFIFFSKSFYEKCFGGSVLFLTLIVFLGLIFPPPVRYPDLFPVVVSLACCINFCLFTFYIHCLQFKQLDVSLTKNK